MSLAMSDGTQLKTWVSRETKQRFSAFARHQGLSDSALLKRMIDLALQSANLAWGASAVAVREFASRAARVTVRLRADAQLLLPARPSDARADAADRPDRRQYARSHGQSVAAGC